MSSVNCLNPLDGRYQTSTYSLRDYFSEYGYMKYRLKVEIEYLIKLRYTLSELSELDIPNDALRNLYLNFSFSDMSEIKDIESRTNHDVKALEYFIKNKIPRRRETEFIHFALTSQDINNTAISLSVKDSISEVLYPLLKLILEKLQYFFNEWKDVPMIGRTHGQFASPTTIGKEFYVYYYRINQEYEQLENLDIYTKFGGAVGNLNAHFVSYPNIDWITWSNEFIFSLNLKRSQFTTQIDSYDSLSRILDSIKRLSVILIDLCQDLWLYISYDYIKLKINENEIGSSTMPHKVNPINFENAEANFKLCSNFSQFLSSELPISRLQRDLTDSTLVRNIGTVFGYFTTACHSLIKGLKKIDINREKLYSDLNNNPIVIAEAIQTILRKEGYKNPYEELKKLTRNKKINMKDLHNFIFDLDVSEKVKNTLYTITPHNYIGKFI